MQPADRDWEANPWIFCGSCGCPRHYQNHPCPECKDVQFSHNPNPQFEGWGLRQMGSKKKAGKRPRPQPTESQGLLFEEPAKVQEVCPVCLRKCKLFRRLHKLSFGSPEFKSRWYRHAHKEVCPICKKMPQACEAWKRKHEARTCVESNLGSIRAGRRVPAWWVPPQTQENSSGSDDNEAEDQADPGADAPGLDGNQPNVAGAGEAHARP